MSVGSDDAEPRAVEGDATPEDGPELPPIPDALLAPLLDAAGEALRLLPPIDLPPAARRLRSFDRRGLATPAARHQLRKLLEENEVVLAATAASFGARPGVTELAEAWDGAIAAGGDAPMALVTEAAADGRLPLLACVLIARLPDSFEFGLGLAVAVAGTVERESGAAAAVRAATAAQRTAEEAQRRADAARAGAEADIARLEVALREERQLRRDREQQAAADAGSSGRRRAELEAALADASQRIAAAQHQVTAAGGRVAEAERRAAHAERRAGEAERRAGEADRRAGEVEQRLAAADRRAGEVEQRLAAADLRAADAAGRLAAAEDRAGRAEGEAAWSHEVAAPAPAGDASALQDIARAAEDLAAGLRRLADGPPSPPPPPSRPSPPAPPRPSPPTPSRSRGPAPSGEGTAPRRSADPSPGRTPRPSSPARRAPVRLPPGMLADDPKAIEAMIRTPGLAVIVDGYNVSMLAWPGASAAEQRERLCDALAEFQLRFRCEVTVVFDGAEVPGVRPLRRRGLRIVFSAAGQEADEVVVGEVMFRPADVPVIVVSSDREVRAKSEAEGAVTLGADALLQLMRR